MTFFLTGIVLALMIGSLIKETRRNYPPLRAGSPDRRPDKTGRGQEER